MSDLLDAYGEPFDAGPLIDRWKAGDGDEVVGLLWERLCHQGDVGSASLAAVPKLSELIAALHRPDWNVYALMASIEEGRLSQGMPIPSSLASTYADAWKSAVDLALRELVDASEDELVRSLIAVIAHGKGQHTLAAIALCTEDERAEMLGN